MEPPEDSFDFEQRDAHIAAAWDRLPGPSYFNVLQWVHTTLQPSNYVEIGIHRGLSMGAAAPETDCIGIDPAPLIDDDFDQARVFRQTSDEFFAEHDLGELLGRPVEFAFIDGLHLFEQVLVDFANVERYATPETVVALHDCLPLDAQTADRERTTAFYSGDVWKAVLALRRLRPELRMTIVRTVPTGLCLVRGLAAGREIADLDQTIAEYRDLDFAYYEAHRDEMPPEMPNEEALVLDWLNQRPVSQRA